MNIIETLKQHISWRADRDIRDICNPFFKKCDLNYFFYVKTYYKDSSSIIFTSDNVWCEHYFKSKYPISTTIHHTGIHLWDSHIKEASHCAQQNFNYTKGISIFKKYAAYSEAFGFSAPESHSKALDFYFNNIDLLHLFAEHFKDKASRLFGKSEKNPIIIPRDMHGILQDDEKIAVNLFKNNSEQLTHRQVECLVNLIKGQTIKEIAKTIGLAPKTVEHYLNNIKAKLDVQSRSALISKALTFSIIKNELLKN